MPPIVANGKICYVEIPALDVARSAAFYQRIFGWNIQKRGDGSTTFDDNVSVSGTWRLDRKAATQPALMVHIMVEDIESSMQAIVANGGEIVQPVGADAPEITAHFRDPAGNVLGLYQHRE